MRLRRHRRGPWAGQDVGFPRSLRTAPSPAFPRVNRLVRFAPRPNRMRELPSRSYRWRAWQRQTTRSAIMTYERSVQIYDWATVCMYLLVVCLCFPLRLKWCASQVPNFQRLIYHHWEEVCLLHCFKILLEGFLPVSAFVLYFRQMEINYLWCYIYFQRALTLWGHFVLFTLLQ